MIHKPNSRHQTLNPQYLIHAKTPEIAQESLPPKPRRTNQQNSRHLAQPTNKLS